MVFLPQEVIARKRDGGELSADEIKRFIAGFTHGTVSESQAASLAMAVFLRGMTVDETVALTKAMRDSGSVLDWSELDGPVVDKHSTGGVGDNVSLMLAPILAVCDVYVPMISGRGLGHSGGTLDKLDAIPGYQTDASNELLKKTVTEIGCAIIGQTSDLAPADRALYAIRDVTATVESLSLITSSILSKKLAAGLHALILDVKTGSGAFMQTLSQSQDLAQLLVHVANGAGVRTGAVITDMNEPLASAAGNALEVRNAVDFLTGAHQDPRLRDVTLELSATALILAGRYSETQQARLAVEKALDSGAAAQRFEDMTARLGGPRDFIHNADTYLESAPIIRDVFHKKTGVVSAINTKDIGMAVVALGGGRRQSADKIDYAVGFDQLAGLGTSLDKNRPLARIHARDETTAAEAACRLIEAYEIGGLANGNPLIAQTIMPKGTE